MTLKNGSILGQTGLNLIRIVIGSYFMALSLNLVTGVEVGLLFSTALPPRIADLTGSILLLGLSISLMAGLHLRVTALCLTLLILAATTVQNLLPATPDSLSDFWRDLTLATAVLLTYAPLGRSELRRASVLAHHARLRRIMAQKAVKPRRVPPPLAQKRPVQQEILSALIPQERLYKRSIRVEDPEPENIFADL